MNRETTSLGVARLGDVVQANRAKILNPELADRLEPVGDDPILVVLAAGKGTRFGPAPKCAQLVGGIPLARHSINAFRRVTGSSVVCIVGYEHQSVRAALGEDVIYVLSDNPVGGTGYAVFEAFSVDWLLSQNALLVIAMGDRIVTENVFRRICSVHGAAGREAGLTFLTAVYEPPANKGKGRVLRNSEGKVVGIIEQRDIDAIKDGSMRMALEHIVECNCPLYVIRAKLLHKALRNLSNENAQRQFYLTDIVAMLARDNDLRTLTVDRTEPQYALLTADVTRPEDLQALEQAFLVVQGSESETSGVERVVEVILEDRAAVQVRAIARQIREAVATAAREGFGFDPYAPVAIGVSGGRFRIAFMHPDMARFYGPAWQMTIGAGSPEGDEQILVIAQCSEDRFIHLLPTNQRYRYNASSIPATLPEMFPDSSVLDLHSYEVYGTKMTESLLVRLGYVDEVQLQKIRESGRPLPAQSCWVSNNMRHPLPLVCNALASIRTLRVEPFASRIRATLGWETFRGLRILCAGNIPQGGFASSSAVTVAAQNAINALCDLRIPADLLVSLACQAEYGTGVRAGSLDQATAQKGSPGVGTLISSNPRDNYCVLGTYPVPTERFKIVFPYSVERDCESWRWSWEFYGETQDRPRLTTGEIRKLTGKAAEIAAILVRLPLGKDFFKQIEADLLEDGVLSLESRRWIVNVLRALPPLIGKEDLRLRVLEARDWYVKQLMETTNATHNEALRRTDATFAALFAGWRNPTLQRSPAAGSTVLEHGVPLRSMVAYLFAEVARNFRLIHNPDRWIHWVTWSQRGDRCVEIEPGSLPAREQLEQKLDWEKNHSGSELLNEWLRRCSARYFDYRRGLEDHDLDPNDPPEIELIEGANFFRGLALIDFAEAMLKRAFGTDAVAVRVNGAGQGDYFQVHIDTQKADVEEVKRFIRLAFYRRFDLDPNPDFVEVQPGGKAFGVRLSTYDKLLVLADELERRVRKT